MEKKKNLQMGIIGVLAVAVLFMAIGFAAYSQTLNINGAVTVKASKWSIHWDQASFAMGTGSQPLSNESGLPTLSNTSVSDLIIKFCFINRIYNIDTINDFLYDHKCKTLN